MLLLSPSVDSDPPLFRANQGILPGFLFSSSFAPTGSLPWAMVPPLESARRGLIHKVT